MAWCLIKEYADKFRKALKDGTIDPVAMSKMTSEERRNFIAEYVGAENAKQVNALFESKLLLKNQQRGMITWAKQVAGITPKRRQDLVSRIENMTEILDPKDDQFLNDLVDARLRIEVTREEAKTISDLSKDLTEKKQKANELGIFPSEEERLEFGFSKVAMENYINDLKLSSKKLTFKEDKARKVAEVIADTAPATAKSILASIDNSFWGRQGIKVLANPKTSGIWGKNFIKSWSDITKTLGGDTTVIDAIKADIYSRPNAINGTYKKMGLAIDILSEEAYPSSAPEAIPAFGRLFKASEVAYNGAALRLRADLADMYVEKAQNHGVNTGDATEAKALGHLVNSLTGRGSLTTTPEQARRNNVLFFSIKFVKSNLDTLTAHQFDKKATPFMKKEAAKASLSILGTMAFTLMIAKALDPDSVDEDPRSTNFGKIKLWGHWVDITGGMASMIRLAFRIFPSVHDGEWGWWRKNMNGKWVQFNNGDVFAGTGADLLVDFAAGKLSPAASLLKTVFLEGGRDFKGDPLKVTDYVDRVAIPIPIQTAFDIARNPDSEFVLGSMILDGLGFSTTTSIPSNKVSGEVPENVPIKEGDIFQQVEAYSKALNQDPEEVFKILFSGQRIMKITGTKSGDYLFVIDRDDDWGKRKKEYAKKYGISETDIKEVREEHIIPVAAGGYDNDANRQMISYGLWQEFTKVDNAYIRALKADKITKKEGDKIISDYKKARIAGETEPSQEDILKLFE